MEEHDLTGTLSDGAVALKIPSDKHPDGERFVFRSPSGEVGLWLKNLVEFGQQAALGFEVGGDALKKLILDDGAEEDIYRRVMGDTLQAMLDDGVLWSNIQEVFAILLKKWGTGKRISESIEELRGEGSARTNRATRRAPAKAAPAKRSSPKAGSKSSRARTPRKKAPASSATRARTTGPASTRESATSASKPTPKAV